MTILESQNEVWNDQIRAVGYWREVSITLPRQAPATNAFTESISRLTKVIERVQFRDGLEVSDDRKAAV
ncbi:MAG: hypothetical protein CML19_16485 [Pusillimonas sp.]|nr:hypothetical protein [Pusillimonas sp.]